MPESDPHYQKNQRALELLIAQNERYNELITLLFAELNISPEQLRKFIQNKDNFTQENWEHLTSHQALLELKLQRDLANIRNPLNTKKKREGLNIPPQWLFVR